TPRDLNAPEYADLVASRVLEVKEKGFGFFETEHKTKNGRIIPVEISSRSIQYENKPSILSIVRDISERHIAEKKLRESEENFRTITEDSHLAITILQDDLVVYTNQQMADMFGYDREEMLTWTPKEYAKTVAEDSLEFVMEQVRKKQTGDPDVTRHYPIHSIKSSSRLYPKV
ncbi:unnamed protein product, partial [marine sediment metagenome]